MRELANIAWEKREGGIPKQHDLDTVVRQFSESNYKFGGKGPVLLVDLTALVIPPQTQVGEVDETIAQMPVIGTAR